jgi:hypothetical protein
LDALQLRYPPVINRCRFSSALQIKRFARSPEVGTGRSLGRYAARLRRYAARYENVVREIRRRFRETAGKLPRSAHPLSGDPASPISGGADQPFQHPAQPVWCKTIARAVEAFAPGRLMNCSASD